MTKKQAEQYFKANYELTNDYCRDQLAWSGFVDGLCKNGEIKQRQYENWGNPKFLGKGRQLNGVHR